MSAPIQSIPLKMIDGSDATLGDFAGKVLLLVNVASRCSFTPQYDGLELLCEDMGDRGFTVLGFPANDFAEQEPGDDEQITEFCRKTYSASFPMFSKIAVTGDKKHPLYEALTEAQPTRHGNSEDLRRQLREFGMTPNPDPELLWNFEKFVVSRDGQVVGRFTSDTVPDNPALVSLIDAELRK
jgi:glutathione peroxidase